MSKRSSRQGSPLELDAGGYDSSYEGDEEEKHRKKRKNDWLVKDKTKSEGLVPKSAFAEQYSQEARRSMQSQLRGLTAYDRHKLLINQYYLTIPGAVDILKRDQSKDKRDFDVIKDNHQFLWEEDDAVDTWGKQIAKKYHDKLFKEYCICDLRKYKENKVGIRWRIEKEVVTGKGQFSCGEQHCMEKENLKTWEINFAYVEHELRKNSLVKIRLCSDCSHKLNFHHKRKEVTKKKNKKEIKSKQSAGDRRQSDGEPRSEKVTPVTSRDDTLDGGETSIPSSKNQELIDSTDVWREGQQSIEEKSRDEEFEEFLEDLFL
ncbi:protein FRA10AC1-like [Daphnia carinata]|uniref:protein FRA10AC1-like n=1 Tax=Daphnia carinata TaxID=120202 RepID=UPI002580A708|nr:protein FRA10AC1-like [Daphnia carinata]